jgi:hypothetical protein
VVSTLERPENRTPEHFLLINAIITLPGTSLEEEVQRRITAINAVTAYCGAEEPRYYGKNAGFSEGRTYPITVDAEKPVKTDSDTALRHAIQSVLTNKRPVLYFLCVGNTALAMCDRIREYLTAGSQSRHFLNRYVMRLTAGKQTNCNICDVKGIQRIDLLIHAETSHGTVMRVNLETRIVRGKTKLK